MGPQARRRVPRAGHLGALRGAGRGRVLDLERSQDDRGRSHTTLFDEQKPRAAFKQTFGWELPERGDDVPAHNVFLKFDAKKLSALFDRIYVKPTDKIGGATAQEAYDVLFKGAVTRFAREVALVKAALPKAQLAKQLKAYQAAAKGGAGSSRVPRT